VLTLVGSLFVELRRDRRRVIGTARVVAAEFNRSWVEISSERSVRPEERYYHGPFPEIGSATWRSEAALFVGALTPEEFKTIDSVAVSLHSAGEWGFT
jgi:hypothetical protein